MGFAAALAAAIILAPTAARAEDPGTDWRSFRDWLLSSGRPELLKICAIGQQVNARDQSLRDPAVAKQYTDQLLLAGNGLAWISATRAGFSTAMDQACPDVW